MDTEKFSVRNWLVATFRNHEKHAYLSPQYMFTNIVYLLAMFIVYRIVRRPIELYYHWDDPLKPSGGKDGDDVGRSSEEIRERIRYK